MKRMSLDEIWERDAIDANCTCECGCREPTQVLSESQRLNNQCATCHYSHR